MSVKSGWIKLPIFHTIWLENIKLATHLLNNGSSVQTSLLNRSFVIDIAVRSSQIDMVQLSIDFEANVNKQGDHLNTPLH